MLDPVHDECGIAAVYHLGAASEGKETVRLLVDMLIDLQNRGQLAAGISTYNSTRCSLLDTFKDVGSVSDVFRLKDAARYRELVEEYAGEAGIGHTRYATCGRDDPAYAQPFERHHGRPWKWFAFGFNGNVANFTQVRSDLISKGYCLVRDTDTELLMHHLSYALRAQEKPDFMTVFGQLSQAVDGAYSLAFLNGEGDMVVARDPYGFRPLCYGVKDDVFAAASESTALERLGFDNIAEVEPGELVHVTRQSGPQIFRFAESKRKAFCFFEYVYFANASSRLNDRSVYMTRCNLGKALARDEQVATDPRDCVAVAVPDTARPACDAMANELSIPSREGLMRNRYLGRSFIEGANRSEVVRRKFTPIPEVLSGKRVFLVEDSVVRSTTLRVIVRLLREQGGAKEVHVRVACPPIMAPCGYGIDMSTVSELFAPKHFAEPCRGDLPADGLQKAEQDLGADSLRYLSVDALTNAIGLDENKLCLGCLIGKYPTVWGGKTYEEALRTRDDPDLRRTYERIS